MAIGSACSNGPHDNNIIEALAKKNCVRCGLRKLESSFPKKDKLNRKSICSDCWNLDRRKKSRRPRRQESYGIVSIELSCVRSDWPSVLYDILKSEKIFAIPSIRIDEEIDLASLLDRSGKSNRLLDSPTQHRSKKRP
jgi:hypothetical protein